MTSRARKRQALRSANELLAEQYMGWRERREQKGARPQAYLRKRADDGGVGSATGLPAPNAGTVGSAPTLDLDKKRKKRLGMKVTKSAAFDAGVVEGLSKEAFFGAWRAKRSAEKARKALRGMGIKDPGQARKRVQKLFREGMTFSDRHTLKKSDTLSRLASAAGWA